MEVEVLYQTIEALTPSTKRSEVSADRPVVEVLAQELVALMQQLNDNSHLGFNILLDHTAIDWEKEGQFELDYLLYSTRHAQHLLVLTRIPRDNPIVPTVSAIWKIAEWQEREVYDLFGVLYDNHPDLRRLFLEDEWQGFPLRKDYQDDFMLESPK